MSEQKVETKDYRGFEYDEKSNTNFYYIKEFKFKIKDVDAETLNEWEKQLDLLRNDKIEELQGFKLEKDISEEILSTSLEGYNSDVAKKIHPRVRTSMAGEVAAFLSIVPPREEQDLLRKRIQQVQSITK